MFTVTFTKVCMNYLHLYFLHAHFHGLNAISVNAIYLSGNFHKFYVIQKQIAN